MNRHLRSVPRHAEPPEVRQAFGVMLAVVATVHPSGNGSVHARLKTPAPDPADYECGKCGANLTATRSTNPVIWACISMNCGAQTNGSYPMGLGNVYPARLKAKPAAPTAPTPHIIDGHELFPAPNSNAYGCRVCGKQYAGSAIGIGTWKSGTRGLVLPCPGPQPQAAATQGLALVTYHYLGHEYLGTAGGDVMCKHCGDKAQEAVVSNTVKNSYPWAACSGSPVSMFVPGGIMTAPPPAQGASLATQLQKAMSTFWPTPPPVLSWDPAEENTTADIKPPKPEPKTCIECPRELCPELDAYFGTDAYAGRCCTYCRPRYQQHGTEDLWERNG